MDVRLIVLVFVGLLCGGALVAGGLYLLKPSLGERQTRADIGNAMLTASVVSLAIFALQIIDENRISHDDEVRQEQLSDQALRLQLGLSNRLRYMDLSGEKLKEIQLPFRDLAHADLSNADLRG